MRIRFLGHVQTGAGTFKPGDEADLAEKNAAPLVAAGHAEVIKKAPAEKADEKPKKARKG